MWRGVRSSGRIGAESAHLRSASPPGNIVLVRSLKRDEALALAERECRLRGWPWREPVRVSGGWWGYHVMTNADMRGGNVNIHIRRRDGKITRAGFAQR
jgi:hypothetical protein